MLSNFVDSRIVVYNPSLLDWRLYHPSDFYHPDLRTVCQPHYSLALSVESAGNLLCSLACTHCTVDGAREHTALTLNENPAQLMLERQANQTLARL